MSSANEAYRRAANSPAGRDARETVKSAADTARDIGEQVSDFADDVSRRAAKQYGHAQDMAVDAYDDLHAAIRRNPVSALAIALGIGFLFGAVLVGRR